MKCCAADQPDCRHLEKHQECWSCTAHGWVTINPQMKDECSCYEAPGEHSLRVAFQEKFDDFDRKILEYDLWWHELLIESIRDGILYAVVAFTALALLVWWTA